MPSYAISTNLMEGHYADAYDQFARLVGKLNAPDSQRLTHGEVETLIHCEGMELLRRLIQGHVDQRSAEESTRDRVVGEDGIARTHRREGCLRRLETRFGEVMVRRRSYGARGLESVFPLDAELNLPPDKYSHGLCEQLVEEVIGGSFDEAVAHLDRLGGGRMGKRQAEEVSVHVGQDFDAFYRRPLEALTDTGAEEKILVISADGKGIVMHPEGLREATRAASERAARKQRTRLSPSGEGPPQADGHGGFGLRD